MIYKRRLAMSLCCTVVALSLITQSSALNADAIFGSSLTDTEDIEIIIDTSKDRKNISKYIYGLNSVYDMSGVTVYNTKQSGVEVSSYNWEINAANLAASGNYENSSTLVSDYARTRQSSPALFADKLISRAKSNGISSRYVTLQMMGFVANDSYGIVNSSDTSRRWATVRFNKNDSLLMQPDIHDDIVYIDEYVSYLVNTYGYAADGGINGYFLDSEPEHWNQNYAILNLDTLTAEELLTKSVSLANTVKKIDPTALVYGPSISGIEAFVNLENPADWEQYSSSYSWFLDYYLEKMEAASNRVGVRMLDVLDLHFVSDAKSVVLEPIIGTDTVFANEERVQAVRVLWDSNYTENSSTGILYKQHTPIIPTVQASIRMYYPNTKLSFSEYNFGGGNHISGGIAQADVLGVFGEQDVYMACLLPDSADYDYQKSGINLYTNYDGEGSGFGNVSVYSYNGGDIMSSVYASVIDGDDSSLKAVFLNKNESTEKAADVTINSKINFHRAKVYSFDEGSSEIVLADTIENIEDNIFSYTMNPMTAYLFEFDGDNVIEDEPIDDKTETTVTTVDIPEHVEVTGETYKSETTEESTSESQPAETVTSISVVGTDSEGETITEIVSDTVEEAQTSEEKEENDDNSKKGVPVFVKVLVGILVAAVFAVMLFVLVTDNKNSSSSSH